MSLVNTIIPVKIKDYGRLNNVINGNNELIYQLI